MFQSKILKSTVPRQIIDVLNKVYLRGRVINSTPNPKPGGPDSPNQLRSIFKLLLDEIHRH